MHGLPLLVRAARAGRGQARPTASSVFRQCRPIQISASSTATESSPQPQPGDALGVAGPRDSADARFEVLGSPFSLLSVTLSASQKLYTRRGTLASVAGKLENVQSTLSILSPLCRALLGVPFLYQRISSTTPITALIATKSPTTSFSVLPLDGTTDWLVAQRTALLAWTGHTLSPSPRVQTRLPFAHWGSTHLTGRGLAALAAPGHTYTLTLAAGEDLVLHPSHVVAYSVAPNPPIPFRLKSTSLRLQVPALPLSVTQAAGRLVPGALARCWTAMQDTDTYRSLARTMFTLRTMVRRTIWGDRLFLHFRGPTTILMSSRGVRVADVLTRDDVNEIADAEAGVVAEAVESIRKPCAGDVGHVKDASSKMGGGEKPFAIHIATVDEAAKVSFEEKSNLDDFLRR